MKFDSIGALAEIGPFLGTLDKTYSLMRQLGTKTDSMWNETKLMFSQKIECRKLITFELPLNDIKSFLESSMFGKCQKMLELFRIKSLRVTTNEQYKGFLYFIKNIDFINMIEIKDFYLSVYENKDDDINLNNIILTKEDQEPLFEQYSKVGMFLKEKGKHLYNQIHSFYFISDVPKIKQTSRYY